MEAKREIPEGTRWGTFVYIKDVEGDFKDKRPILVQCDCGVIKAVDYAQLQSGLTGSCGTVPCLLKYKAKLQNQINALNDMQINHDLYGNNKLSNLTKFWNEIESTGNTCKIGRGMMMTYEFLNSK